MPQSARTLITACPKPTVSFEDCQREFSRVTQSASPQRSRYTGPSVWCRDLGSLSEADQPTGAVSTTLLVLHPWHQRARPRVERRSPQESQPAEHRVHLASGAAALGWPRHKDGRRTHAQSSLLQRAPRRKVRSWCSQKRYEDQLMRQLAQAGISHQSWQPEATDRDSWRSSVRNASCKFEAERHEPQRKNAGGRKGEQDPIILIPNLRLSCAH